MRGARRARRAVVSQPLRRLSVVSVTGTGGGAAACRATKHVIVFKGRDMQAGDHGLFRRAGVLARVYARTGHRGVRPAFVQKGEAPQAARAALAG